MEVASSQRNILMTTRKLRRIMNVIRGKKVVQAYQLLRVMPYRAAGVVLKNLIAASHNAKQKFGVGPTELVVSQATADEGRVLVRFKPRAQGRMYRRTKELSHLTIKVKVQAPATTDA